jgi:hypothetical protein
MSTEILKPGFGADQHPDENQLLLALEGELSLAEIAEIERHIATCWDCRARAHEMQRGVLAFVEYREKMYLPEFEGAPNNFNQFRRLLNHAAVESPRVGRFARLRSFFDFGHISFSTRWVTATAAITIAILVWTQVINPSTLSASELLTKAVQAENPAGAAHRKVRQKIRVKTARTEVVREFEWDTGSPIANARWGTDPENWTAPMTAEGFSEWHDSLTAPADKVTKSGNNWTLDTVASGGGIREASMVIRKGDFHPIEQHIRFSDESTLDLQEVSFQIAAQTPSSASPASPRGQSVRPTVALPPQDTVSAVPSAVNLEEAELELRYTMFAQHLDEDEDLEISRAADAIFVSGIASSPERLRQLQTSLTGLPAVRLSISEPGLSAGSPAPPAGQKTTGPAPAPLLKAILDSAFTSVEARRDFVDTCLSDADSALSNAWALKKLAERYSDQDRQALKPESRVKLDEMMRVHIEQIAAADAKLDRLQGLLPASRPGRVDTPQDFRGGIAALFDLLQRQDSLVAALVVGTQSGEDLASASEGFRSVHEGASRLAGELKPKDGSTPK